MRSHSPETGLKSGTAWSVTLGANNLTSSSPSMTFVVTNGSYSYRITNVSGYLVSPTSGIVTVDGSSFTKIVTFSELFSINFVESNLPTGNTWTVTLNGTTKLSSISTITFLELNGSYSFSVNSSSTSFSISPSSSAIVVNGANANKSIQFLPIQPSLYLTGSITPANATFLREWSSRLHSQRRIQYFSSLRNLSDKSRRFCLQDILR